MPGCSLWWRGTCKEGGGSPQRGQVRGGRLDRCPGQALGEAPSARSLQGPARSAGPRRLQPAGRAIPVGGLGAVCAELLRQGPVSVGQGGHQTGTMVHLQRTGTGGHGQAPPALQKAAPHEVARLLHRERDGLPRLRHAQAGQGQVRGRGAVPRLLEDVAVWRRRRWRPALERRLGGCTCKEQSPPDERVLTPSSPTTAGTAWAAERPRGASPNSARQPTPTVGLEQAAANGRGAAVRLLEEMIAGVAWGWAGGLDL